MHAMKSAIDEIEGAFRLLRRDAWSPETKVSDDVLDPLFATFYEKIGTSNRLRKTDYHVLVDSMTSDDVDSEMIAVLDKIVAAEKGRPE